MRPVKLPPDCHPLMQEDRIEVEGRGGGVKTKTWPSLGCGLKMSDLLKVTALYICSLNASDTFRRVRFVC